MERHTGILVIALSAIALCGCQRQPTEVAAAGSAPAVDTPIGPIPGPAMQGPGPTSPFGQNPVALMEGRRLFDHYNCSGCHGGHAGGGMGPSLRDPVWRYGNTDAQIFSTIAEGRDQGMPAWGTKVPEDQIWKLVAYVQSLRTPNEPDPPR